MVRVGATPPREENLEGGGSFECKRSQGGWGLRRVADERVW